MSSNSMGDTFVWMADVDTAPLQRSLNKAEKAQRRYERQIERLRKQMYYQDDANRKISKKQIKSLRKQIKAQDKVISNVEREGRTRSEYISKFDQQKKKLYERLHILDEEKAALGEITFSWKNLAKVTVGGIFGFGFDAMKKYIEFNDILKSMDSSIRQMPMVYGAASDAVQRYTGYLDYSRESVADVVSELSRIHFITKDSRANAAYFKGMTKDVLQLAKSMGSSTDSVTDFYRQWINVYQLPHQRLRNIAASMKAIQETTGLSGEEVLNLGKSLEDVLSRMTRISKDSKSKVTVDLIAMGGAFKKLGIDENKIPQLFSEALDYESDAGRQWLAFIAQNTGTGVEEMRKMIEAGDVEGPIIQFSRALKKIPKEQLKYYMSRFSEFTKMNYTELTNLMNLNEDSFHNLIETSRKAYEQSQLHAKRAEETQTKLMRLWNDLKRIFESFSLRVGKVLVEIVGHLAQELYPWVIKVTRKFEEWVLWATSPAGGQQINAWISSIVDFMRTEVIPMIKGVINFTGYLIEKFRGLGSTTKWYIGIALGIGGVLKLFGLMPLVIKGISVAIGAMGSQLMVVTAGLTALYFGAKKIAGLIDDWQSKKLAKESKRKSTQWEVDTFSNASENERRGYIKSQMKLKTGGLITKEGSINIAELQRRAGGDQHLVKTWTAGFKRMLAKTDMHAVKTSLSRDMASANSTLAAKPITTMTSKVVEPVKMQPMEFPKATETSTAMGEVVSRNPVMEGQLSELTSVIKTAAARLQPKQMHPGRAVVGAGI